VDGRSTDRIEAAAVFPASNVVVPSEPALRRSGSRS